MGNKKEGDIYKVFSNQNRVKLVVCLSTAKSVTDLLSFCELSQSALSQHLKILKEEGVAVCHRDGKKQIYSIKNKKIAHIAKLMLGINK